MATIAGGCIARGLLPIPPPSPDLDSIEAVLEADGVLVWRLPLEVSQSRIGDRAHPSNACTLIAIRLAELLHRHAVRLPVPDSTLYAWHGGRMAAGCHPTGLQRRHVYGFVSDSIFQNFEPEVAATRGHKVFRIMSQPCPKLLSRALVNALLDGNANHAQAMEIRHMSNAEQNFTIPDAIVACGSQMFEVDFCAVRGAIHKCLPNPALLQDSCIYMVMIAFERTVLLAVDRETEVVALIDSHLHINDALRACGSVLAAARLEHTTSFCAWLAHAIFPESAACRDRQEFELSLVRFSGDRRPWDCVKPPRRVRTLDVNTQRLPIFRRFKRFAVDAPQGPAAKILRLDARRGSVEMHE